MKGVFLQEGENVETVDPETGLSKMDSSKTSGSSTRRSSSRRSPPPTRTEDPRGAEEVLRRAREAHGRFPKTLIFAANDLPHTSPRRPARRHRARRLRPRRRVRQKITGRVDRPLQRIREFRNRPKPGIVVTVDLLTTGVDIPDLEFIVFLRPVKSRILFEQMLGRGTRKGEKFPDKDHFTVFDCFDGTLLLEYFRKMTTASRMLTAESAQGLRRNGRGARSRVLGGGELVHCCAEKGCTKRR
jgi:type I restriction enzyme R subunit